MSFTGTLTWDAFGGMQAAVRPRRSFPAAASDVSRVRRSTGLLDKGTLETAERVGERRGRPVAAAAGVSPRVEHAGGSPREERRLEPDWSLIVARCVQGDSGAWAELVKAHHRRVYSLCYRFTGSPHDSEDLTQDVFLKVYSNLSNFDGGRGSFPTWLTTLTRNLLVDHFRRSRQQRVTESIDAGWEDSEEQPILDKLADPQRSPHEHAASREIERMVQEALTRVSPELREAVILRDLQDLDYKEIAQVLKIPEGTVKSRISRGRAELARLLERNKGQVV